MQMKLYFNKKYDEGFWCRPLTEWIKIAKEINIEEMELIEAKRIKVKDSFWSKSTTFYEMSDKKTTIKIK